MVDRPELDAVEQRLLGSLMEKQRTVPDNYPLSLNGLRTACNQSTSRDPVVAYDEATVLDGLNRLRDRGLIRFVKPTGLRVVKYHQRLEEVLGLDPQQAALLAVLLLRGPQSIGELRARSERLHLDGDRDSVETTLHAMADAEPALVRQLERRAGQHDPRWIHLLGADLPDQGAPAKPPLDREQVIARGGGARDRLVARQYDAMAASYADHLADGLDRKPFDRWLLDRIAVEGAGAQGLDVGCGPGQVAGYLAARGVAMTGLDLSAEMLARARVLQPDIQVVQGSFAVPPMPRGGDPRDPGWAVVTAWYAFVHLAGSEIAPTIAALQRVLRRGGVLALATHVGDAVEHSELLFDEPTELTCVLHDANALIAAATQAGLVDLEWYRRSPLPHEAQTERLYLLGRRSTG